MTNPFSDIYLAMKRFPLWGRLAYIDLQQTYKRSIIGLAWIVFAFSLFIGVKVLVFGSFAPGDPRLFSAWLTVGFWVYTYIQFNVLEGCSSFVSARSWILGTNMPLVGFALQAMVRVLLRFVLHSVVVIAILFYLKWTITPVVAWAVLGFLCLMLNALWVQIALGIICARSRDIGYFIQSIMQIMFFITPILYFDIQLGDKAWLLKYNPFTHYLAIVRDPIVMYTVPVDSWVIVGIITVMGWLSALILLALYRRKVAFWV